MRIFQASGWNSTSDLFRYNATGKQWQFYQCQHWSPTVLCPTDSAKENHLVLLRVARLSTDNLLAFASFCYAAKWLICFLHFNLWFFKLKSLEEEQRQRFAFWLIVRCLLGTQKPTKNMYIKQYIIRIYIVLFFTRKIVKMHYLFYLVF